MKNALQVQENRTRLPVCFLHNRKLKAKCAKETAQNKRRRVCVCVCMYACMYIMRLCQMADAKEGEGEAKQDGTEECQSICLCCGV